MAWDDKGFWDDELLSSEQKIVGQSWNVKYHYPIARKIKPPQPKYRAFKSAEEFRPFRDWWIKNGETIRKVDHYSEFGVNGMSWESLLINRTFEDGTPFGVIDDQ
jgi:hypothetical protein